MRPQRSALRLIINSILLLLVVISWGWFMVSQVWPAARVEPWQRPAYWVGARLALEGKMALGYSDQEAFGQESIRLGAIPDILYPNFPTTVLPFMPLAPFRLQQAQALWSIVNLLSFLVAWTLLARALRLPLPLFLALTALLPFYQPWVAQTFYIQIYAPFLLAIVLGSLLAVSISNDDREQARRRSLWAGLAYGLGCVMKQFYGGVQLLVPLALRQWRVVSTAVVSYAVAALVTLLWVGPDIWARAIWISMTWRGQATTAVTAYQTVHSFLAHLFRYDSAVNPAPILDAPWLAELLWWVLAALILGVSGWAVARSANRLGRATHNRLLPYALAVPVGLLLSPVGEDYHFVMAIYPLVVCAAVLWHARASPEAVADGDPHIYTGALLPINLTRFKAKWTAWIALVLAIYLLGWPWRFYNVPGTEGWNAFGYYPRLYGTLVLWGLMIYLLARGMREGGASRISDRSSP